MSAFSWLSLQPAIPELFLAFAGMLLLVVGVFRGNDGTKIISWMAVLSLAVAALFLLGLNWETVHTLNGFFVLDRFTAFAKFLVLLGMMAATVMSVRYIYQEQIACFEYPVLLIFSALGMMLMISADNFLAMYMGLELQSLSLYILASIRRDHIKSSEAGLKYFVLGALASGMLLFGISLVYGYTGHISFLGIDKALSSGALTSGAGLSIGMVFVLAGIAFKISAVPFHMWTPDVYEGAPTSVTALFAIVPKIAAIVLLMRVLQIPFGYVALQWQPIIWFLSAASMIVGAIAALRQNNIKRLMAYSAIGNMGYTLIGVATGTEKGAAAVMLYMTIYMIMSIGVFGIILLMRRGGLAVELIDDLAGLSRTNPALGWIMAFLMFSMSGIPPLAGFFGKLFIFESAIAAGSYYLAVIGVLSSVVAAYYYLRIIKVMFFDEPADVFDKDSLPALRFLIWLSAAFALFFVISPETLTVMAGDAVSALFAG